MSDQHSNSSAPAGQMLIYQTAEGRIQIEARLENETLWLTQQQMAELFQTSRTNVVEHIAHIYDEGKLDEAATCLEFRQVRAEGARCGGAQHDAQNIHQKAYKDLYVYVV